MYYTDKCTTCEDIESEYHDTESDFGYYDVEDEFGYPTDHDYSYGSDQQLMIEDLESQIEQKNKQIIQLEQNVLSLEE